MRYGVLVGGVALTLIASTGSPAQANHQPCVGYSYNLPAIGSDDHEECFPHQAGWQQLYVPICLPIQPFELCVNLRLSRPPAEVGP